MGFFDTSEKTIKDGQEVEFKRDEVVKFKVKDFKENNDKGTLTLKTTILSGDHSGKDTNIILTMADNIFAKKAKLRFLRCFWSDDDIKNGAISPSYIVNRMFQAKANVRDYDGKKYVEWYEWKDLGEDKPEAENEMPI